MAFGQPQANGIMWLLSGSGRVRTLSDLNLNAGRVEGVVPESSSATALAESSTGVIGAGLATATTGALQFHNGGTGALLATVPIGAPALDVAAGADGNTFYVLNGGPASRSVTVVDQPQNKAVGTVGVSLGTVSIAAAPAQNAVYTLTDTGTVAEVSTVGRQVLTQFSIGHSGRDLALSPDGTTGYVLKGQGRVRTIAVVNMTTETVLRVLPAPADAERLTLSPGGSMLYVAVGTPAYGNVQVIPATG